VGGCHGGGQLHLSVKLGFSHRHPCIQLSNGHFELSLSLFIARFRLRLLRACCNWSIWALACAMTC